MQLIEILFWFSSIWIIPLWSLMWFLPKHEITSRVMNDIRICILPLLIPYAILVIPNILDIFITLGSEMPTPDLVIEFFQDDDVILIGWLHFLAFDILAGRYIWKRMIDLDRPIYLSTPILILSMMVAPLGFLLGIIATWDSKNPSIELTK
ncbi:MAG: DUF4281 domain-containing protein [Euryarchaeota archaeon]|jgi:hypothetical protein|nr:DUF4281 domain-containing protein [Euryarchaeota archaeon]MBT4924285.1 DUF4281 domain-containing protein [Euryarchaeota archaeon]MBT5735359.1 DUF4281 domain-containing protein [Euryarchaeota archaeon]MBT7460240.1 DUF4281 domain-containing protein [Euryarchaeota archaeon]